MPGRLLAGRGTVSRAIEMGEDRAAFEDRLLAELQEANPDLDFHPLPGAWLTLPKGTPYTFTLSLTRLAAKLSAGEREQ